MPLKVGFIPGFRGLLTDASTGADAVPKHQPGQLPGRSINRGFRRFQPITFSIFSLEFLPEFFPLGFLPGKLPNSKFNFQKLFTNFHPYFFFSWVIFIHTDQALIFSLGKFPPVDFIYAGFELLMKYGKLPVNFVITRISIRVLLSLIIHHSSFLLIPLLAGHQTEKVIAIAIYKIKSQSPISGASNPKDVHLMRLSKINRLPL